MVLLPWVFASNSSHEKRECAINFIEIKFISSQLQKIENISNKIAKLNKKIDLEVDGGINQETAKQAINCGANVLVAGSFIFGNKNYSDAIKKLRS